MNKCELDTPAGGVCGRTLVAGRCPCSGFHHHEGVCDGDRASGCREVHHWSNGLPVIHVHGRK